ncbi:hypothetical protein NL108_012264 [Boleophthalmus pectinirostris]|nr:hypothetical protein NL108_012264 [Boleophthalmus pectinirostris]
MKVNLNKCKTLRRVEKVEHFQYLRAMIDRDEEGIRDITAQLQKARQTHDKPDKKCGPHTRRLRRQTKLKEYGTIVQAVVLFMDAKHGRSLRKKKNKLKEFQSKCLRR